jgi:hypothetical protein
VRLWSDVVRKWNQSMNKSSPEKRELSKEENHTLLDGILNDIIEGIDIDEKELLKVNKLLD